MGRAYFFSCTFVDVQRVIDVSIGAFHAACGQRLGEKCRRSASCERASATAWHGGRDGRFQNAGYQRLRTGSRVAASARCPLWAQGVVGRAGAVLALLLTTTTVLARARSRRPAMGPCGENGGGRAHMTAPSERIGKARGARVTKRTSTTSPFPAGQCQTQPESVPHPLRWFRPPDSPARTPAHVFPSDHHLLPLSLCPPPAAR